MYQKIGCRTSLPYPGGICDLQYGERDMVEGMTSLPWIIYVRVSTDEQATGGISLDAQLASCRAYATARGWTVGEEIVDGGFSAKDLRRPGAAKVLELYAQRKIAGVIVWRLDRLLRRVRDLVAILDAAGEHGGLVSVTESLDTTTPMGRFVVHLLASIAQLERETVGQRVKMAMDHARTQGRWLGRAVPAGCDVVVVDGHKRLARGEQAESVARAWPEILAGASLAKVCHRFRAEGIRPTARPGMETHTGWTPATVRNLLLSHQVLGVLVDTGTQAAVRTALARRMTPVRRGEAAAPGIKSVAPSPFAGLLRCPTCDASLVQVTGKGNGGVYRYFRCTARIKRLCAQKDERCEPIEAAAFDAIGRAVVSGSEYAELVRADLKQAIADLEGHRQERLRLSAERDQVTARIGHLVLRTQIGTATWDAAMRALGQDLERIDQRMAHLQGTEAVAGLNVTDLDVVLERIQSGAASLATAPPETQRQILSQLVRRIRLEPETVTVELYRPEGLALSGGSYNSPGKLPRLHGLRTVTVRLPRASPWRPHAGRHSVVRRTGIVR